MKLSAKLFLENGDDYIFGPGRVELLRSIEELGSLRKAAQKLGMSYRWAWGRLTNAEKALQTPLLTQDEAGGGRPKVLTQEAKELLAWYASLEKSLEKLLQEAETTQPAFLKKIPRIAPTKDKKTLD